MRRAGLSNRDCRRPIGRPTVPLPEIIMHDVQEAFRIETFFQLDLLKGGLRVFAQVSISMIKSFPAR